MQQLSLFDFNNSEIVNELAITFTREEEGELTKAMASALIEIYRKESNQHEENTGA